MTKRGWQSEGGAGGNFVVALPAHQNVCMEKFYTRIVNYGTRRLLCVPSIPFHCHMCAVWLGDWCDVVAGTIMMCWHYKIILIEFVAGVIMTVCDKEFVLTHMHHHHISRTSQSNYIWEITKTSKVIAKNKISTVKCHFACKISKLIRVCVCVSLCVDDSVEFVFSCHTQLHFFSIDWWKQSLVLRMLCVCVNLWIHLLQRQKFTLRMAYVQVICVNETFLFVRLFVCCCDSFCSKFGGLHFHLWMPSILDEEWFYWIVLDHISTFHLSNKISHQIDEICLFTHTHTHTVVHEIHTRTHNIKTI